MKFIMIIVFLSLLLSSIDDYECKETLEIYKQTIEVKEITNKTLKEMVRKKDSIIFIQDSIIVKLQSE